MTFSVLAAIAIFFASVLLSQKIAINSGSRLDDRMKLKLVEVFPKRNMNYTMIVFAMIVVFLVALYLFPQYVAIISVMYIAAFLLYLVTKLVLNVRKLKELSAPERYIRDVMISFAVFIGGAVAAAIIFAIGNADFGR